MNRQGAQKSLVWLGPIIQSEPDTLDALPIVCLCELLFISFSEANNSYVHLNFQVYLLFQLQSTPEASE